MIQSLCFAGTRKEQTATIINIALPQFRYPRFLFDGSFYAVGSIEDDLSSHLSHFTLTATTNEATSLVFRFLWEPPNLIPVHFLCWKPVFSFVHLFFSHNWLRHTRRSWAVTINVSFFIVISWIHNSSRCHLLQFLPALSSKLQYQTSSSVTWYLEETFRSLRSL